MINIPFNNDYFSEEFKGKISGINVTVEFENIESALMKVGKELPDTISPAMYSKLVSWYQSPVDTDPFNDIYNTAVDYMQRGMLNLAFYEQLIFFATRIGNDGVTIKKNVDETTAYKYQTDELKSSFIATGWFWISSLIELIQANPSAFPEWETTEQAIELAALPITFNDFNKWFGVDSLYFFVRARHLITEVWLDDILPRTGENPDSSLKTQYQRATVYKVMALACFRFAYSQLPASIRVDIDNEMSKTSKVDADKHIKDKVAISLELKADAYMRNLEQAVERLRQQAITDAGGTPDRPIVPEPNRNSTDKFVFSS